MAGPTMLEREMKRGSAELLILALLEDRDRHGYEIGKHIDERSGGTITFHITSLYPTLYRLESKGLIEGRWVERPGNADADIIASRPGGTARSCGNDRSGRTSRKRSTGSRGSSMRDWSAHLRETFLSTSIDSRHPRRARPACRGDLRRAARRRRERTPTRWLRSID